MRRKERFIQEIKERSTCLHDYGSFVERLMEPVREFIPHDASGVTLAAGTGFDTKAIYYGYPPGYLADWSNQDAGKVRRWRRYYSEGRKRGYSTLRSTDMMKNFQESGEYKKMYASYGQRDSIQTMFFSAGGSPMGVYACNRFSDLPMTTEEERSLFETISPYMFYAFRKYRRLIDFDFFSIPSFEESSLGMITADNRGRITWLNGTAERIMEESYGAVSGKMPGELRALCKKLCLIPDVSERPCFVYREIETVLPYGSAVCFRFDDEGGRHLPVDGEGRLIVIDTRHVDRDIILTLSRREIEVVRLLARGMQDKEIADAISISEKTVQTYTQSIFKKLGVSNRTEAAVKAVKLGIT